MFSYCGSAYLLGTFGGGAYGLIEGVRKSPSNRFRILLNSIMNASGRHGSRAGNAFGCVAFMYSGFLSLYDGYEVDSLVGQGEWVNCALAGVSTGVLYKSAAGPRAAVLAGLIGGGLIGVSFGAEMVAQQVFGKRVGRLFG